ncbi:DNA topoisomerase 3 [Burkholderia gladioli]|uniref:DNA topoisomerase 3 n=1 Tax=Burkholderia gladioli TaxID=28095 RepID=UPI0028653C0E|nr:DNA topoisomerase 3 [Burkholderia gladioli]MDR8093142.1 DNA topoisomerase 3 [Burkholderia gladioli]
MRLIIAEKPELARAIVDALGGGVRKNGFYECANDDIVGYCYGHMLELVEPHEYDERYKKWNLSDLPWVPVPWKLKPVEKSKDQFNVLVELLSRADSVVHAGDPDEEGQLLVDEILEYVGYKGPVQRVLINDNTPVLVKRALDNLVDNSKFVGLSLSALARSVSDQMYGINASRLYTVTAQNMGYNGGTLPVGRVQTPILGLVVRRCRENAAHTAAYYYLVTGEFEVNGLQFPARYRVQEHDDVDEKGRLRNEQAAKAIAASVSGKPAVITQLETEYDKATPAPLPYNLLKLQSDASRKFGFKPDQTKEITQTLRDKHKLITYNRSDTEYLNEEQHANAPGVLAAIKATAPALAIAIDKADPTIKSRAFNSKKVTVHHGIIPQENTAKFESLTDAEQKIYMLIARAYVAQFWPLYKYDQTKIEVTSEGRKFGCTANVPKQQGWKVLYRNDQGNEDLEADEDELAVDLRALSKGAEGNCTKCESDPQKTRPQPLYKMDTLLTDLTRVAKYIKDDHLRKVMLEKDKDKAGEHGGIGTPATRDSIIAGLFDAEYLAEVTNGKTVNVVATKKGEELYDTLPDQAKYPDMTAIWHEQQKRIIAGEIDAMAFVQSMVEDITREIERVGREGLSIKVVPVHCPKCKTQFMRRIKTDKGAFWACSDRETCKHIMNDRNGKPVERVTHQVSTVHMCDEPGCGKGLVHRFDGKVLPGKKSATPWWSCSGYPDCTATYPDKFGKPNYEGKRVKAATATPSK